MVKYYNILYVTLSPIIMEVEKRLRLRLYLKGNYYWRVPFLTSMIMGASVYVTAEYSQHPCLLRLGGELTILVLIYHFPMVSSLNIQI